MAVSDHVDFATFMEGVKRRNPHQSEFVQAVQEVAEDVFDFIADKEQYHRQQSCAHREPDRVVSFRVCWEDDNGNIRVQRRLARTEQQRHWPLQGRHPLPPQRDRERPQVSGLSSKPSRTHQPACRWAAAKAAQISIPKASQNARSCASARSFMTELYRHIGADVDVPAGDIGVGGREIGFMFGQYKRITNHFTGVLTGKGLEYGGSLIRTEATGYGAVYFLAEMLAAKGLDLAGKTAVISGSGNVATHAAEKLIQLGAKPVTLSDFGGFIYDPDGMDQEKIDWVKAHKTHRRGRIEDYLTQYPKATFHAGKTPWGVTCDVALPCATQNELLGDDARTLVANGCMAVAEGANMPTNLDGVHAFKAARILFAPGKAANAGGVAVSGLEMSQNSERRAWKEEELQQMLRDIMCNIHNACRTYGTQSDGHVDYVKGANIAGFKKVADAMLAFGVV